MRGPEKSFTVGHKPPRATVILIKSFNYVLVLTQQSNNSCISWWKVVKELVQGDLVLYMLNKQDLISVQFGAVDLDDYKKSLDKFLVREML